nr:uncharacterized protein LOC127303252 [Lolium perenne]
MENSGYLADVDAATSRSSAKRVAAVVGKFSDEKKQLVRDIGFGGILQMPQINKTPRKFTVWLLSNVDISSRSIVVNGQCKVKITDKAIERVLGIPCGPKKLIGLETNVVEEKNDFIKLAIGSHQENNISYCNSDSSTAGGTNDASVKKRVRYDEIVGTPTATWSEHVQVPFFRTLQPAVSSYLTAYLRGSIQQKLSYGQVDALKWHNARMIHHVRKTKELLFEGGRINLNEEGLKSVIEVHMETLMANIFQDNLSLSQKLHTHTSTNVAAPASNMRGTSSLQISSNYSSIRSDGHSSVGGVSAKEIGAPRKNKEAVGGMFSPLVGKQLFVEEMEGCSKRIKVEQDSASAIQPGKCDQFILSEHDITAIIENGSGNSMCPSDNNLKQSMFSKLKCKQRGFAPNPWMGGAAKSRVRTGVTNDLHDWLANNNSSTLRRNWIVHALPKYIELDGFNLKDIFIKKRRFTAEAFDIAIRRTIQLDSSMYGLRRKHCWRHIMESDFAMLVLENKDPLECISIIYQFTMMFNEYDISECRMIIVPALVAMNWCAYYWDMEEERVHVVDPKYVMPRDQSVEDIHKINIAKIQACLQKVVEVLFEGWKVRWSDFRTNFVEPIMSCSPRVPEGILTLLAIKDFDGSKYVERHTEESVEEFTKLILYEMVSLEGNYGKQPEGFIQTII